MLSFCRTTLALSVFCIFAPELPATNKPGGGSSPPAVKPADQSGPAALQGMMPDIAVDQEGCVHLVYLQDKKLVYQTYDSATGKFSNPVQTGIEASKSMRTADPEIAVHEGIVHAYVGSSYTILRGDEWSKIQLPEGVVDHTGLAVAPNGTAYLAYRIENPLPDRYPSDQFDAFLPGLSEELRDLVTDHYELDAGTGTYNLAQGLDPEKVSALAQALHNNGLQLKRGFIALAALLPGATAFEQLAYPDIQARLPIGGNQPLPDICAAADGSLHIFYRQGTPASVAYRYSADGGVTWSGLGIGSLTGWAPEMPVGAVRKDGVVFAFAIEPDGVGYLYRKGPSDKAFVRVGDAVAAPPRHTPSIAFDEKGRVYVSRFGGPFWIWDNDKIVASGQLPLPAEPYGHSIGYVELATAGQDAVYAVYDSGRTVATHNEHHQATSIHLVRLSADGKVTRLNPPVPVKK